LVKIIVVNHTLPNIRGFTSILFKKLIPILQEKIEVDLVWIIHSNINTSEYKCDKNEKIIKMNNYDNAFDILKKEKPDLIYIIPGISIPDYAFSLAAKSLKIFRIGSEIAIPFFTTKNKTGILSQINRRNRNNQPNKIQNFFANYKFLINTQRKTGWNYFKIFLDLCSIFLIFFPITRYGSSDYLQESSTKFQLDLHFVESEQSARILMNLGFEESKIMITGSVTYDEIFKYSNIQKKEDGIKQKYKILVLTTTILEIGIKAIEKRNLFISEVINKLIKIKDNNEISIKIHPTHENLKEYRKIIDEIDPEIPIYQKESLEKLIYETDLIITPVTGSSTITGLIARKQIIIWNVFDVKNDVLIDNYLAIECKDPNKLLDLIKNAKKKKYSNKKIDKFISEYLFKVDGKATERIANKILKVFENKQTMFKSVNEDNKRNEE
jgi:hypothetical protein